MRAECNECRFYAGASFCAHCGRPTDRNMDELPRCDRIYKETVEAYMQCDDQARYMLIPMLCVPPKVKYACLAHLSHVVDRMCDIYAPVMVRRLSDE